MTTTKYLLLPILALGLFAAGLWFALSGSTTKAGVAVAALLPSETLAMAHLPDLNLTREQWRQTDLYRLWREPAVQDFLERPLSRKPDLLAHAAQLEQLEPLELKDLFCAVVPAGEKELRLLGGFRFQGNRRDVEKVLGPWRQRALSQSPDVKSATKPETVSHRQHRIEVTRDGGKLLATVYAGDWFLAGNDVPALQALLDRVDEKAADAAAPLLAHEDYVNAVGRMPADYATFGYARVGKFLERGPAILPQGATVQEGSLLRQVQSIGAATKFEGGRIRDVLFIAMPKAIEAGDLTRSSLALTTMNSFLYVAGMLQPPAKLSLQDQPVVASPGIAAAFQGLIARLARGGVTREDWNSAFGPELGVIGDWHADTRFPALLATLPVKDPVRANQILANMAAAAEEESAWTTSERDGIRYYTQAPANPMVPVAPTVAISDQLLVAGFDPAAVEAAMRRAAARTLGLATANLFEVTQRSVPAPKTSFAYLDLALFYTRLDAAVRPMLIMAAAFVPGITERVDLGRLPPADVVVRHLSPLVMSQSHDGAGYVIASVGPISIYHAALGVAAATGAGADFRRRQNGMSAEPDPVSPLAPPAVITPPEPEPPEPEAE